jgi:uncharacterized protein (DUF302 family)
MSALTQNRTSTTLLAAVSLGVLVALGAPAGCSDARSAPPALSEVPADGVNRVRSAYSFDETVARLRRDVEAKGIRFFAAIDQAQLGAGADIAIPPSTLLLFGNPPLGVQFLAANPLAGLDWPVRMLVVQDADGGVWVAWTDFAFVQRRYGLADKDAAIAMASQVSASIASSVVK